MADGVARRPLVVIAAGGTGGHMFPAQAFAEEMRSRGWSVALITDSRGRAYAQTFPADWIEEVSAATFSLKAPHRLPGALMKLRAGTLAARKRFTTSKPDLVAGFGGYPSYPSLAAAVDFKTPIIIHEQNSVLGRVNRLFASSASFVACGFERLDRLPDSARLRKRVVGNPVRAPIRAVRDLPYPELGDDGDINLLVTGGSQGARLFGEVVPLAIAGLPDSLRRRVIVVQQVRDEQISAVQETYRQAGVRCEVSSFFRDMHERLARAHLVIARAGASTVTELAIVGRPSILVPLAIAMDDHQTANAEGMLEGAAADILTEAKFTPASLQSILAERLSNAGVLQARARAALSMGRLNAARDLADLAEQAVGMAGKDYA
jgi:UDP-N-acetylglucosamine--N-acetylmuramyl-(pentapeptide) pyrophosphoryl-undecaprenol N-acetylglucosamine transferase